MGAASPAYGGGVGSNPTWCTLIEIVEKIQQFRKQIAKNLL